MTIIPKFSFPITKSYKKETPPEVKKASAIQGMLNQGIKVKEIAEELGMSAKAVYTAIGKYGLKRK